MFMQKIFIPVLLSLTCSKPAISMEDEFVDLANEQPSYEHKHTDELSEVLNQLENELDSFKDNAEEEQKQVDKELQKHAFQLIILASRVNGFDKAMGEQQDKIQKRHDATACICNHVLRQIQSMQAQVQSMEAHIEQLSGQSTDLATQQVSMVTDTAEQNQKIAQLQKQAGKISTIAREGEELKEKQEEMDLQIQKLKKANRLRRKAIKTVKKALPVLKKSSATLAFVQNTPPPITPQHQSSPSRFSSLLNMFRRSGEQQPLIANN